MRRVFRSDSGLRSVRQFAASRAEIAARRLDAVFALHACSRFESLFRELVQAQQVVSLQFSDAPR